MSRTFKIVALAIGLAAFAVLAFFGFAIWVFIPLFPAAVLLFIALTAGRHKATKAETESKSDTDHRKAA
jgi:fatty acid desaturase